MNYIDFLKRRMMCSGPAEHDYSQDYLTFTMQESTTSLGMKKSSSSAPSTTVQYRKNGGNWTTLTVSTSNNYISASAGDVIEWKSSAAVSNSSGYTYFQCPAKFDVSGNIMSMIGGDNYKTTTSAGTYALRNLFYSTKVVDASNLVLPATSVSTYSYAYMFSGCTELVHSPKILPANSIGQYCYYYMFNGCSKMLDSPELPAAILSRSCYAYMFYNCSVLSSIKCLTTNNNANGCTGNWVAGVAGSGTFTKAASFSNWGTGNSGIPSGWTVVNV